jgi:hypothetical protein
VIAALSSYFSDPQHTSTPSVDELRTSASLVLNNNTTTITPSGTGNAIIWTIAVTDGSLRCPRGTTYTTYMGTSTAGAWSGT